MWDERRGAKLRLYLLIESVEVGGETAVYRNWLQAFTAETLTTELEANGFAVEWIGSDLTGSPLVDDSQFVGVIARKT